MRHSKLRLAVARWGASEGPQPTNLGALAGVGVEYVGREVPVIPVHGVVAIQPFPRRALHGFTSSSLRAA